MLTFPPPCEAGRGPRRAAVSQQGVCILVFFLFFLFLLAHARTGRMPARTTLQSSLIGHTAQQARAGGVGHLQM